MAEKKPMTTREAIIDVLKRNGGEMSTKEVVKKVLPKATNLKGKTASHTVYTTMLSESKKPDGKVVQVQAGRLPLPEAGRDDRRSRLSRR